MGRSFATYKKDMAPKLKEIDLKMEIEDLKRERDEQKKEREKAIGNEQQKFRNELTNKMSLIESLKKKLKEEHPIHHYLKEIDINILKSMPIVENHDLFNN